MTSFPRIRVIPIAAMALMLGLGAAAAQTSDDEPGLLSREEVLIAVLEGSEEDASNALREFFSQAGGAGEMAEAALALIEKLEGDDPLEVARATKLIREVVTAMFSSQQEERLIIYQHVVAAVLLNDPAAPGLLLALLEAEGSGSQEILTVGVTLIGLINRRSGDPLEKLDAADRILATVMKFLTTQRTFDNEEIAFVLATITTEIANVLLGPILAAAGDPQTREDAANLGDPPVDDVQLVSDN